MSLFLGTDLWDKPEAVITFNDNNSMIIDRIQKIVGEFCKAQLTVSSNQKRLLEKFLVENEYLKKSEYNFSSNAYFLTEKILDIINAEETFGDSLLNEVDEIIKTKGINIKRESKLMKNEKKKLFDDLAKENQKLDNDFKKYRKRYYEKNAAYLASIKAEENKALSRNQVDNFQSIFVTRKFQYDDAMREYEKSLETFNKYQEKHYSTLLGEWGLKAQNIEEERYSIMKSTFTNLAEICRSLASKFNEIADNIESRIDTIEYEKDCMTIINLEKTGDVPPQDIPFQNLEDQVKTEIGLNNARTSKLSNSGSESISSNNGHTNNFPEMQKKSQSLSRNFSSVLNKENSPINGITVNSYKIFSKIFGGSKKSKEISADKCPIETEGFEQNSSNCNENQLNDPCKHEITVITECLDNLGKSCVESRKNDSQRRISLFQSMTYKYRNKSFEDSLLPIKNNSFFGKFNRVIIRSHCEKRRSKSISGIIMDQNDNFKQKSTIRTKKLSFSIDKKVAKPKLCPKSVMKRQYSSEHRKERYEIEGLHSKSIEVLRIDGPIEIVSTPADALATIPMSNCISQSEFEKSYADEIICPIKENTSLSYSYIGSCVAIHEYESLETSTLYLSFKMGEQFYIIEENDSIKDSGWLLVERIDRTQSGYVPTSYMDTKQFETPINMFCEQPILIT